MERHNRPGSCSVNCPLATIEEIDKRKNGDDRKADRALGSRGSDDERRLGGHHDS